MLIFTAFTIVIMVVLWPVIAWVKGASGVVYDLEAIKILSLVFLVMLLPAIYLHIEYFVENLHTKLTIDYNSRKLSIEKGKVAYDYSFEDVLESILYRSIYFSNEIDNVTRWKSVFSDYGYWFVRFSDGETFFFTSLMIDTSEEPLIKGTEIRYSFFTNIKEENIK